MSWVPAVSSMVVGELGGILIHDGGDLVGLLASFEDGDFTLQCQGVLAGLQLYVPDDGYVGWQGELIAGSRICHTGHEIARMRVSWMSFMRFALLGD